MGVEALEVGLHLTAQHLLIVRGHSEVVVSKLGCAWSARVRHSYGSGRSSSSSSGRSGGVVITAAVEVATAVGETAVPIRTAGKATAGKVTAGKATAAPRVSRLPLGHSDAGSFLTDPDTVANDATALWQSARASHCLDSEFQVHAVQLSVSLQRLQHPEAEF